jgi:membrane protein YdbS with pleckstrin-like domain
MSTANSNSTSGRNYTKADFPIQGKWLLKPVIQGCWGGAFSFIFIAIIFGITFAGSVADQGNTTLNTRTFSGDLFNSGAIGMGMVLLVIVGFGLLGMFFSLLVNYLRRANFDYSFEENFIVLHQGIITRSQRNIPYAVIQHVIIKQGLVDRYLLHLTTLMIENAVQDASAMAYDAYSRRGNRYQIESIGFLGNRVTIPGLSNADALKLKGLVLKKMKENQVHPSITGL